MRTFGTKKGLPEAREQGGRNTGSSEPKSCQNTGCISWKTKHLRPVPRVLSTPVFSRHSPGGRAHPSRSEGSAQTGGGQSLVFLTLRVLLGTELKACFTDFCSGRWGRRTASTSSRFLLFFNEAQSHLLWAFAQYKAEGHNSKDHKQCKIIC